MSNTDKPSETPTSRSGEPKSKAKGKRIADTNDLSPGQKWVNEYRYGLWDI